MELMYNYKQTNLEKILIKRFVHYMPLRLEWAIDNEEDVDQKDICNRLDFFEFHYRHYIVGLHKNLSRVNFEIKRLNRSKLYKEELLYEILNSIENDIIHYELYELMPRHKYAEQKVLNFLKLR